MVFEPVCHTGLFRLTLAVAAPVGLASFAPGALGALGATSTWSAVTGWPLAYTRTTGSEASIPSAPTTTWLITTSGASSNRY